MPWVLHHLTKRSGGGRRQIRGESSANRNAPGCGSKVAPIKRERGKIKEVGEGALILRIEFRRLKLVEHEQVAAKQKLVRLLLDLDCRVRHRLAVLADDLDDRVAFAVLFDVALDALVQRRVAPELAIGFGRLSLGRETKQHEQQGDDCLNVDFHG